MDPLTPPEPNKLDPLKPSEGSSEHLKDVLATNTPTTSPVPEVQPVSTPAAQSGAGHVDLGKILLPKKETPGQTPLSAQRVNAGALLEQELAAGTEGTLAQQSPEERAAAIPQSKPAPVPEDSLVKPIETYQRDIESVVQDNKVSVLSIATAEANRRSATGLEEPSTKAERTRSWLVNAALIAGGLIFLTGASGALAYLVTRPTSVPVTTANTQATPFITVDAVKQITITEDTNRSNIMASLNAARQATTLSLGLIEQLSVSQSTTTLNGDSVTPLSAQQFLTLIAPHVPPDLARTVAGYLLGVHVYDGNEAFIIARVDSYQTGYSGMLSWESFLKQDLSPLFDYTPTVHIPEENVASTTPAQQFTQTGFVDRIVENHDARVLQNNFGDIYLLWTFLDRNTIVITTNQATLREIISRLKVAPITPIPGQ
jgi:hypothetical protein